MDEIGRVCGTYGGELNSGILWGDLRERDNLGDVSIERRILLQGILKKLIGIVE